MIIWGSLIVLVMLVLALLIARRGPFPMAKTADGNPDLPALALDDVRLHGRIAGPDAAPLVLVLHGGPGADHRSLLPLETLSVTHRVLFFDQRGAGLSQRVKDADLTMAAYLQDIDSLIAHHAQGQGVALIGHSWGAMLAVAYLGHNPDAVQHTVLIEPGFLDQVGYTAWEARRAKLSRSPRVILAGFLAGVRAQNADPVDQDARHDFLIGSVVHAFANHPKNPYHRPGEPYSAPSWRFGGRASDRFWADISPAIEAMAAGLGHPGPILFLAGGCNDWTGPALQQAHAARFPDARCQSIPDSGHDVVSDQPEAAVAAIRAFLSGVPP